LHSMNYGINSDQPHKMNGERVEDADIATPSMKTFRYNGHSPPAPHRAELASIQGIYRVFITPLDMIPPIQTHRFRNGCIIVETMAYKDTKIGSKTISDRWIMAYTGARPHSPAGDVRDYI